MRKLLRSVARAKMKKEGIQHINRKIKGVDKKGLPVTYPSYFASNWKSYVS